MNFKKITSITIYCSSSNKISESYKKEAKKIGFFLGQKKIKLIYGRGSNGLMGEVARSVKEKNGDAKNEESNEESKTKRGNEKRSSPP